ncbi:MAG TPA: glycosyltransferase family 2 protein [Gammaproteobacteria bacterium]|nr:glycosyltransferase family 2 protein [Gammaproteobacteria bacterium]
MPGDASRNEPDGRAPAPTIGAVVTSFNGGDGVLRCLDSLVASRSLIEQIVVVDGGSTDGSPERIASRHPHVRILELGENLGPCVARNTGLRSLTTDLALLIDDDVYLAPTALALMLDAYVESGGGSIVCPRILLYPESDLIHSDGVAPHFLGTMTLRHGFSRRSDHSDHSGTEQPAAVGVKGCLSACLLAEREPVLQAGGFEEIYFFYFEDLEFSLRMRSLGYTVLCVERALAYHERGSGTAGLAFRGAAEYPQKRYYLSERNRLMTILIHYRLATIVLLVPPLLVYELASLSFALKQGFVGSWTDSIRWQARNWQLIRSRRSRAQASRKLSDAELLGGGPIPLAPGLVRSKLANGAIAALSAVLDGYWRISRRFLG